MCLVAALAVASDHFRTVRLVALGTERNFAMNIVAETACQSRVLALDLFQLDDLLSMARETFISDVIGKFDYFWCVRIVMATQTGRKIVVRLATVALVAGRNNLFHGRWMTDVAVLTTDLRFMGSAIGSNRFRCRSMALDAICA